MKFDLPVSPYIASVGDAQPIANVVLSLIGLTDNASLCFTGNPAGGGSFGGVSLTALQTELQVLADFGFTGPTSVRSRVDSQIYYFLWDVLVSKQVPNADPDSVIVSAAYGIGAHIATAAFNVNIDSAVTATSVTAAASLNAACVVCEAIVVGVGVEALKPMEPLVAISAAPFTMGTMTTVGEVQGALNDFIADHGGTLPSGLVTVRIDTDLVARAWFKDAPVGTLTFEGVLRAQTFALERAFRSVTCAEALTTAGTLSPVVITDTYANVLGLGKTDQVTSAAQQIANDILTAGR